MKPGEDIIYFVDAVIDSSRYYVIRLKDRMSTRSLLVGIGFRERDTSFDFKNCLNDYVRYVDRMSAAEKSKAMWADDHREIEGKVTSGMTEKADADVTPSLSLSRHRDLSIPAGQKITIKCKLLKSTDMKCDERITAHTPSKILPRQTVLAPPPQARTTSITSLSVPLILNTSAAVNDEKEDRESKKERGKEVAEENEEEEEEEEWGDFDSATIAT